MMKKLFTILAVAAVPFVVSAQSPESSHLARIMKAKRTSPLIPKSISGNESAGNSGTNQVARKQRSEMKINVAGVAVTKIGETTYDLQTNRSMPRRVIRYGDGKISAIWTFSDDYNDQYPGRGTGYNHFNGTEWQAFPSEKIEDRRTGFSSITLDANGSETVTAHNLVNGAPPDYPSVSVTKNTIADKNTWVRTTPIGGERNVIWMRSATSGSNMYIIGNHNSADDANTNFVDTTIGVQTPLYFFRSTDNGTTFVEKYRFLPGYDSVRFRQGGADEYAIDAKDSIVAILLTGRYDDITLWKSTNYGVDFTKIVIDSFPIVHYDGTTSTDINGDGLPERLHTAQSGDVIIDNEGKVHAFFDDFSVEHDGVEGNAFLGETLYHWDEVRKVKDSIAAPIDINNDGVIDAGSSPDHYNSLGLVTAPSCGIDERGDIYVVYAGTVEGDTTDEDISTLAGQPFRDIYTVKTSDNGEHWSSPINLTNPTANVDLLHREDVYPAMARHVDNSLHIIWQQDFEPGVPLTDDGQGGRQKDDITVNEMYYMAVDVSIFSGVSSANKLQGATLAAYPNPAKEAVTFAVSLEKQMNIEFTMSNVLGQQVMSISKGSFAEGSHNFTVSLSEVPAGVYFYTLKSNGQAVTNKLVVTK